MGHDAPPPTTTTTKTKTTLFLRPTCAQRCEMTLTCDAVRCNVLSMTCYAMLGDAMPCHAMWSIAASTERSSEQAVSRCRWWWNDAAGDVVRRMCERGWSCRLDRTGRCRLTHHRHRQSTLLSRDHGYQRPHRCWGRLLSTARFGTGDRGQGAGCKDREP